MPDVQHSPFGVRFDEAIRYLQGKLPEASLAWDSLAGPVHAKVFTVAGATSADLARDIHQSLVDALANGSTITQFRKDFDATVQRHGWAYNGKRGWRTGVIFDANMRSAHMAGRWEQVQANAERRPFLQYRTAGDSRVRPQHRQWNGLIFPVADAFWQTHYPPNGWGCRCTVRAYSQADLEAKNLQVSPPLELKTRAVVNRDGDLTDVVPVGIDPGWDHNVGQAWIEPELALGAKLARLPRELQGLVVDKTISPAYQAVLTDRWTAFQQDIKGGSRRATDAQVVGFLDSATLDGLVTVVPELSLQSTAVAVFGDLAPALAGLADLPAQLRSYRAVLWDRLEHRLVIVTQDQRLELQLNATAPFGPAVSVLSANPSQAGDLVDAARFQLLAGRVR